MLILIRTAQQKCLISLLAHNTTKEATNSNSNNNNNKVVDNVVQQFGQNIVSISDTGQRQLQKFRALLGAIINELPAPFAPSTLSQSLSFYISLSVCLSFCLCLYTFRQFWATAFTHCRWAQEAVAEDSSSSSRRWRCRWRWRCHCTPRLAGTRLGTAWNCLELPGTAWLATLLGSLPCRRFICAVSNVLCPLKQASSRLLQAARFCQLQQERHRLVRERDRKRERGKARLRIQFCAAVFASSSSWAPLSAS